MEYDGDVYQGKLNRKHVSNKILRNPMDMAECTRKMAPFTSGNSIMGPQMAMGSTSLLLEITMRGSLLITRQRINMENMSQGKLSTKEALKIILSMVKALKLGPTIPSKEFLRMVRGKMGF